MRPNAFFNGQIILLLNFFIKKTAIDLPTALRAYKRLFFL
jgi:hypothetical protein